ncbi:MAG: alpha/beta hydrolase [Caldilineaceae bacterium]
MAPAAPQNTPRRRRRIWPWVVAGLLLLLLIANFAIANYFYGVAVARNEKEVLDESPDLDQEVFDNFTADDEWLAANTADVIQLRSDDGLMLHAAFYQAPVPTGRSVILAHGYGGNGDEMAQFGDFYRDQLGYNILIPDARGHGFSEGDYIGFGWHERRDYQMWIDWLEGRVRSFGQEPEILLHGISMGAATVMMTSGEDLPPSVKAVIEDGGYTAADDVLAYQLGRLYGLPAFPIVPSTSLVTQIRAGYSFAEASALKQIAQSELPTLFIHGEADTFVPYPMVNEVYAAHPGPKQILVVPDAPHGANYIVDPETYEATVKAFLATYMPNPD